MKLLLAFIMIGVAAVSFAELPVGVLYTKGEATSTRLAWPVGGEQPVVALDYGGETVGGFAIVKVKSFTGIVPPVLRLSYATHPDGLSETGCFTRRGCIHYLGDTFDNPVLPANVNRFETYTITRAGTYVAPLIQGQQRYVRVQLDTPGTTVELEPLEIRNVGSHSVEPIVGSFACSDERVNRTWLMSVRTTRLATIPNSDGWRVVDGKLLPRWIERGSPAGLCETARQDGEGAWTARFSLAANPHHDSALGLMFRAADADNGLLAVVSQPAVCRLYRRRGGTNTLLAQMVLDRRIVDGEPCELTAKVEKGAVTAFFNGERIVSAPVPTDLSGDRFGLYVEKEWWPVVTSYVVANAEGKGVFADDFSRADAEGRLSGWEYAKTFSFIADGAKRDRLVWSGDLWWTGRNAFYGLPPQSPYFRDSLELLAYYQTPEGFIWPAPFATRGKRPGSRDFGYFPSDEFSAWFAALVREHYLFTGDEAALGRFYPTVKANLGYFDRLRNDQGLVDQPLETSANCSCLKATDPHIRSYTQLVIWKAYLDGAYIAEVVGDGASARAWKARADELASAMRRHLWNAATGKFRFSLDRERGWAGVNGLALAFGFATRDEALSLAAKLPLNGSDKFHLAGLRGRFAYGFNESAFAMLEGGTWFSLSDPAWPGAQCCTECGFLTKNGFWDESHPDTAAAGVITEYLLGVVPTEPGYRVFRFDPHFVSRLTFARGEVPTPKGMVKASWTRDGGKVSCRLEVPTGTVADVPRLGRRFEPGDHVFDFVLDEQTAFADASLCAAISTEGDGKWLTAPPPASTWDTDPNHAFMQAIDLGAVVDVDRLEVTAGNRQFFPAKLRVEVSQDGVSYETCREYAELSWPGEDKCFTVEMKGVGGSTLARYVRLVMRQPEGRADAALGRCYEAKFRQVRVKFK